MSLEINAATANSLAVAERVRKISVGLLRMYGAKHSTINTQQVARPADHICGMTFYPLPAKREFQGIELAISEPIEGPTWVTIGQRPKALTILSLGSGSLAVYDGRRTEERSLTPDFLTFYEALTQHVTPGFTSEV